MSEVPTPEADPVPQKKRISRPDARAQRSRAALRAAFLDLLDTKLLDHISIKEITERAEVSYPVFFRQFSNKDELLADLATEQVRALLGQTMEAFEKRKLGAGDKEPLIRLCAYVEDHRKLWGTLLTGGASTAMRLEFSRISNETAHLRQPTNPQLPFDLVTELVTNAFFDILTWWMRQHETYPASNVVEMLHVLVIKVYMRPIKIELK